MTAVKKAVGRRQGRAQAALTRYANFMAAEAAREERVEPQPARVHTELLQRRRGQSHACARRGGGGFPPAFRCRGGNCCPKQRAPWFSPFDSFWSAPLRIGIAHAVTWPLPPGSRFRSVALSFLQGTAVEPVTTDREGIQGRRSGSRNGERRDVPVCEVPQWRRSCLERKSEGPSGRRSWSTSVIGNG